MKTTISTASSSNTTLTTLNGIDVEAMGQMISAIREQPGLGEATFRSTSRWIDNRRVTTDINGFRAASSEHERPATYELPTDLPEALQGTDAGASPLEVALAALGSCVTTTLVAHASAKGFVIRSLNVSTNGDLDFRGFLNLADVRTGYQRLRVEVDLVADASAEEITTFIESALRFSPVLDLFRNGTDVHVNQRGES